MARIFSIGFMYNGERYNTMVTVQTSPLFMEYILAHLDADLLQLLPGNRIISPSPKDLFFPNASSWHSTTLMNSIIKAVSMHLQMINS